MPLKFVRLALWSLVLVLISGNARVFAAPVRDGGQFPTSTITLTPSHTPTSTSQPQVVVVTVESIQAEATRTPESLAPERGPNVLAEPTEQTIAASPEEDSRNPLITAGYVGLFTFITVGAWMLFSQRGLRP